MVSSGLGDQFHALTSHLSPAHCAFLRHWVRLVEVEEQGSRAARPQVGCRGGDRAGQQGRRLGEKGASMAAGPRVR